VIRLVSWNMAGRDLYDDLRGLSADIALLQEAPLPGPDQALEILPFDATWWATAGRARRRWRTAVLRLSNRVELGPRPTVAIEAATDEADWVVSQQGTITAADVSVDGRTVFTAVSVYSVWQGVPEGVIYADGSAHHILSDLSVLMPLPEHRLIIAGDWNILFGYGEHGDTYYKDRYATVFARAEALGLRFVGPQHPNGRQAEPWPDELPKSSRCVPTFHHNRQTPATATRQLDFVFASRSLEDRVSVRALNEPDEWGGSDHCRVVIDVDT
jgi:endonuclease/exonuclease/phosphatase family protein